MMKIITVIGARPQFIKAATVSKAFAAKPGVEEILVHTGQHYDENMSDIFFAELEIPKPKYHLGIGSGPHGAQTGKMLEGIENVLIEEKPNFLLVYGDTNSTLAGALAAAKIHISIAHVEARLRSFNRAMPEEINRVLTDHLSDILFAPTETAIANLIKEGISEEKISLVGDVMYDAAIYFGSKSREKLLDQFGVQAKNYVLATVHRAENTDHPERLKNLFDGLNDLSDDIPVILPLHPRTKNILQKNGMADGWKSNMHFCDPVGYLDMVALEKNARLIATDSGGVQKEAFFHGVPCVTLREETEWVELVDSGWNRLAPPKDAEYIRTTIRQAIAEGQPKAPAKKLYGGGQAAIKLVDLLCA